MSTVHGRRRHAGRSESDATPPSFFSSFRARHGKCMRARPSAATTVGRRAPARAPRSSQLPARLAPATNQSPTQPPPPAGSGSRRRQTTLLLILIPAVSTSTGLGQKRHEHDDDEPPLRFPLPPVLSLTTSFQWRIGAPPTFPIDDRWQTGRPVGRRRSSSATTACVRTSPDMDTAVVGTVGRPPDNSLAN